LVIDCDRCHRPVAELGLFGQLLGPMHNEDGSHRSNGIRASGGYTVRPGQWSGQVRSADPSPPDQPGFFGRVKLVCTHRRGVPPTERVVTNAALRKAFNDAAHAGRTRINMREIR
jgi:hypothetical protein